MNFSLLTRRVLFTGVIFSVLIFSACSEDNPIVEESLDQDVCEHLEDGPIAEVTAAVDINSAIAQSEADPESIIQHVTHTRYDVTLPALNRQDYQGFVVYHPYAEDGDYVIYLDAAMPVTVYNHSEGDVVVDAENIYDHSDECALVEYKGIYHFHADDIYVIKLGPVEDAPMVSMLIPALADDDDHDHE